MFGIDPIYLLVFLPMALAWLARSLVRRAYAKYERQPNRWGITGAATARSLLDELGQRVSTLLVFALVFLGGQTIR